MTGLTYDEVGKTRPDLASWDPPLTKLCFEQVVPLGTGEDVWSAATDAVMGWGVKTRSGFTVEPAEVALGLEPDLRARCGPLALREPVRVVALVEEVDRRGFAYGTLPGHPISGEEAFMVHRDERGDIWLTTRSMSSPGAGAWWIAYPLVLLAQRFYRWRYRRALIRVPD